MIQVIDHARYDDVEITVFEGETQVVVDAGNPNLLEQMKEFAQMNHHEIIESGFVFTVRSRRSEVLKMFDDRFQLLQEAKEFYGYR